MRAAALGLPPLVIRGKAFGLLPPFSSRVMVRVTRVQPGSIADEIGIVPGTELLAVNERPLEDFLDWEFLTADDAFIVSARLPDGSEVEYDI